MKIRSRVLSWLFVTAIVVVALSWVQGQQVDIYSSEEGTFKILEYGLPLPWLIHNTRTGWSISPLFLLGTFLICFCVVMGVSLISNRSKKRKKL